MKVNKKINYWVIAIGIILCSTLWDYNVLIHTLILRYVIWSLTTFILVGLLIFQREDFSILRRNIFLAFGVFIVISAISGLRAINFGEWYFDLERYVLFFLYFAAVSMVLKDGGKIAKPLVICVIVVGTYGLWQLLSGKIYAISTMGNRPLWSQYCLLMLPFCYMVKGKWRIIGVFTGVLIVCNIYLAVNRSAIVALIVSSITTAVVFKRKYLLPVAVGIILLGSLCCLKYQRFLKTESVFNRLAIWKQSLRMTRDKFMVGGGNWKISILPYSSGFVEKDAGFSHYYLEAHNANIEVLAEKSIFGLIAYLSIFGFSLFYAYKSRNVWVFMGIVGYMVYVLFDCKQSAPHLMILATLMALAVSGYHGKLHKLNLRLCLPFCLLIIGVIICGYTIRYRMERRFSRANIARLLYGKPDEVIKELSYIPKLATLEKHTIPYCWFRGDAYKTKGQKEKALQDFIQAYNENPYNIFVLLSLGESYFYAGYEVAAIEMFQKVLVTCPNNIRALININLIRRNL